MSVSLEKIDILRSRVNISYEEAKAVLEKTNGDLVEALIQFEKENKTKPEATAKKSSDITNNVTSFVKDVINKGNNTRLIIKKADKDILNLSMTVSVVASIFAPYIPIVGLPLAIITKHKIRIEKSNGEDVNINKVIDKVSDTVNSIVSQPENKEEVK